VGLTQLNLNALPTQYSQGHSSHYTSLIGLPEQVEFLVTRGSRASWNNLRQHESYLVLQKVHNLLSSDELNRRRPGKK
jgi:hypothetical protein